MKRWAALCCAVWLGLCAAGPAGADDSAAEAEQRRQIRRERADVEQRFRQGEAQCAQRFVVTRCVDALKAQRREALAGLRQREIALEEAQRRREVEDSARRVQQKQAEAQARPAPEPHAPHASRASASAPAKSERATRRSQTADDAAEAAARALARQRRASEAQARRDAAEQRQADRAVKGKTSMPLPIPAPLPPASAASG